MADSLPSPTPGSAAELARAIRLHVYRHFAQTGGAPSPVQIARSFQLTPARPSACCSGWRAKPMRWWGNCIWDALAILALLRVGGWVQTACPDCGAELRLDVGIEGRLADRDGVVHFAVPARDWWRSIGFT